MNYGSGIANSADRRSWKKQKRFCFRKEQQRFSLCSVSIVEDAIAYRDKS